MDFSWKNSHAAGTVSVKPLLKVFPSCNLSTPFPHKTPLQECFDGTGQPGHRGTTRCLLLPTQQETQRRRGCPSAFKLHITGLSTLTAERTLLGHSVPSWTGAGGCWEDTSSAHKNPLESESFCSPRTGKKAHNSLWIIKITLSGGLSKGRCRSSGEGWGVMIHQGLHSVRAQLGKGLIRMWVSTWYETEQAAHRRDPSL